MKEIYYLNSRNEKVDFINEVPLFSIDDMFSSTFTTETDNDVITSFKKGVTKYTLSADVSIETFDRINDIFDYDIYNNAKGRFYIGDYYLLCNFTATVPSKVNFYRKTFKTSLTVTTDKVKWLKETKYQFLKDDAVSTVSDINLKKYNYMYSYVYGREIGRSEFNNSSFRNVNFKMILYGPITTPEVTINGHLYKINTSIPNGSYAIIDTITKTIKCINSLGKVENLFPKRYFESDIFQTIGTGLNEVLWSGSFGFDLIIYDERNIPKWI